MSRLGMPALQVGNEFIVKKPNMRVEVLAPEASLPPQPLSVTVGSVHHDAVSSDVLDIDFSTFDDSLTEAGSGEATRLSDVSHAASAFTRRHWLGTAAIITLILGASLITLAGRYWTAHHVVDHTVVAATPTSRPIAGLNLAVPAADFQAKLQSITSQPATLTVGPYSEQLNSDIIKSWLQISANKDRTEYYIHVNEAAMANALTKEANDYARTPINQVTVNEDGADRIVVGGRDGRGLTDPNSLKTQSKEAAKNVLGVKGLQFNTPLKTVPFQAVTAANFDKLLVADITTKKMWAYQNGQLVKTFLVSAGAPATPTPIGQYKVYAKFSSQDMRGTNPNGTPYFQPKVPWVSYFTAGNAVHGVYWHPSSWFGNINSSHGCVGVDRKSVV